MTYIDSDITRLQAVWPDLGAPTRVLRPQDARGRAMAEWRMPVRHAAVVYALDLLGSTAGIPSHAVFRLMLEYHRAALVLSGPRIERELSGCPESSSPDGETIYYGWQIQIAAVVPGVETASLDLSRRDDDALEIGAPAWALHDRWLLLTTGRSPRTVPTRVTSTTMSARYRDDRDPTTGP